MKWLLAILVLSFSLESFSQIVVPKEYYAFDLTKATLGMPTISYERFLHTKGKTIHSLQISVGYQFHFNNSFGAPGKHQFGITKKHGNENDGYSDDVSLGVYQGPVARIGYTFGKMTEYKHVLMYFSPGMGFKYQWYDDAKVYNHHNSTDSPEYPYDYRIQDGNAIMLIPQAIAGMKKMLGNFCVDIYAGLQANIKFRTRTVDYWQTSNTNVMPGTPFQEKDMNVSPGVTVGIKVGYVRFH
ncbi:hypothetical protein [Taibaiella soli]|uniref:Outer membrane protein beta-barrel domain-containing protein n=1 Tax=Taibaiella soli TaxID=1649169 RepID=A0A2W2C484_9BACT|nr:hypothetical protein [Taibaiella soli]PZF74943.1 hypothetical protein DN068_01730 [Taibaiella soli]